MRFETLVSVKNLELAWRRINTGRNLEYKRFFRPAYLAYEAGRKDNLRLLRNELLSGWRASPPARTYLPKPSGLQRPITLLHLEDQIVLQAIANVFAKKLRKRRAEVEHKTVFSNVLSEPDDAIFFVHRWQDTYREFLTACTQHFDDGYRWVAQFDLAAFYDTISHGQLVRIVSPRGGHGHTAQKVEKWLNAWTTYDNSPTKHHGIPQGPVASNFLAESFFLPIDEKMSKLDVRYTRYVDDIRIFGKNQIAVQRAAIELEVACQSYGLIPQGKKFAITEASSVAEVLGQLPSIPPDREENEEEIPPLIVDEAFREALDGRPLRVKDKSRLRYVLYRAPKSQKILNWVLALMERHPEHIDAFCHYLGNYSSGNRIVRSIGKFLDSGTPYPYVRGELWHILARISDLDTLRARRPIAIEEIGTASKDIAHRWGLLHFLIRCEKEGIGRASSRLLSQHDFVQMLLAEYLPESQHTQNGIVSKILRQKRIDPSIVIGRAMRDNKRNLRDYGLKSRVLPGKVQNVYRGLGIIQRRRIPDRDYIGELLSRMYRCPDSTCWKKLLGSDYEYGHQLLLAAEGAFDIDPSGWMQDQNSFNDMITRAFIGALNAKGLPGGSVKLKNKKGELIQLGNILQAGSRFEKAFPTIACGLRSFNGRRNRLPGSHPFDLKGGSKNKFLTRGERDNFVNILRSVFSRMISVCNSASLT